MTVKLPLWSWRYKRNFSSTAIKAMNVQKKDPKLKIIAITMMSKLLTQLRGLAIHPPSSLLFVPLLHIHVPGVQQVGVPSLGSFLNLM